MKTVYDCMLQGVHAAPASAPVARDQGGFLTELVAYVSDWRRQRATIAELSALSDRQLMDIGLTRGDLYASNGLADLEKARR